MNGWIASTATWSDAPLRHVTREGVRRCRRRSRWGFLDAGAYRGWRFGGSLGTAATARPRKLPWLTPCP
jgi:hypothetical protein